MPDVSLGLMRRIDQACDAFERDGKCGPEAIDGQLDSLALDERCDLVRELIPLDLELRQQRGETPAVADYRRWVDKPELNLSEEDVRDWIQSYSSEHDSVPTSKRYRFIEPIGRGGNGDVWRVEDLVGRRPLAVKRLRDSHHHDNSAKARLIREALLTGRLQHPGIPPIYDHGDLDGGAPFFSMKLVEGETFESILKSRSSGDDDLAMVLGVFEQMTQTVAYAHSQGVIHRDLKPQNVMVGAFGEVQVMDWGMAKEVDWGKAGSADAPASGSTPPISLLDTVPASEDESWDKLGHSLTMAGDILGTPAYMSPEQARGMGKTLDTRSDVFTLGAILFEILTHTRLHEGFAVGEAVRRSAMGEFDDAIERLATCDADAELIEICQKCLSGRPDERFKDARALSDQITRHIADVETRARQATIQKREAEVQVAEDQKRRRTQTRAAAVVALASLIGGSIAFWQRGRALDASTNTAVALQLADRRLEETQSVVDEFLTSVADDNGVLTQTPGAQAIRRDLMQKAVDYYQDLDNDSKQTADFRFKIASTHLRLAEVLRLLAPSSEKLVHHSDQTIAICDELIDQFPNRLEYLACKTDAVALKFAALKDNLRYERALSIGMQAESLCARLVAARGTADDRLRHAYCIAGVARCQERTNNTNECRQRFEQAIAIATPIQVAHPERADYARELAAMHHGFGWFFGVREGQWQETRKHHELAVELHQQAVNLQPSRSDWRGELANAQMRLGMALSHVKDTERAEATFLEAIETHEQVVRDNPLEVSLRQSYCYALGNFATFSLRDLDRPAVASEFLLRSAEQAEQLVKIEPDVDIHLDFLKDVATSGVEAKLRVETGASPSEIAGPPIASLLSSCQRRLDVDPNSDKYRRMFAFWSSLLPKTDEETLLSMTDRVAGDAKSLRGLHDRWIQARALALVRNDRHEDAIELLEKCHVDEPTPFRKLLESLARFESDPATAKSLFNEARSHRFKKMDVRVDFRLLMEQADAIMAFE